MRVEGSLGRRTAWRGGLVALAAVALAACGSPPPADGGVDGSVMFDVPQMDVRPDVQIPDIANLDVQIADVDVQLTDACASGVACNGTCVDIQSAIDNCGACGVNCGSIPGTVPAMARCATGHCLFECQPNRANCDGMAANGCEGDLTSATNCGGCGNTCPTSAPMCTMGAGATGGYGCSNGCMAPTPNRCGTRCVDLSSDPANCGACDMACPAPGGTGGVAACVAGHCTTRCTSGNHLCGSTCVSDMSVTSCGSSCTPCTAPANATATCNGTACGFTCNTGFHRCGEVCVSNSAVLTCGSACTPCVAPPNATATCDGMACGFTCNAGFADCDRMAANGCEADLHTAASCNACSTQCSGATPFCVPSSGTNYACGTGCTAPNAFCDAACVNTQTDPAYCGSCTNRCPVVANGRPTCSAGTCSFTCDPGYHRCGNACVADNSISSCGSSCTPCPVPPGGAATCDGTTCGIQCPAGQHSCSSVCVSSTSLATCGNSCSPCPTDANGVTTCDGAACILMCNAGYANVMGHCTDINECMVNPAVCGNGICNNTVGGYDCNCDVGYTFDGTTCTRPCIPRGGGTRPLGSVQDCGAAPTYCSLCSCGDPCRTADDCQPGDICTDWGKGFGTFCDGASCSN